MKGYVEKVEERLADIYFATRDRGSQISAWASRQSEILSDRKILEQRVKKYNERYDGKEVPRPDFWSGFKIIPHSMEFWQNRLDRLHDRFLYTKVEQNTGSELIWKIGRLYP